MEQPFNLYFFSAADVDPNQIFQAFFSQGGPNFGFGSSFPGGQGGSFGGGGFPGGFTFQFG